MIWTPLLSICIPTFNRFEYLKEALTNLIHYAELAGVEVCVSDNNSSDGTAQLLEELAKRHSFLFKYKVQPVNIGLDRNMFAVINMAKGKYIYPLGDDDFLPVGKLQNILDEITKGIDVLILNGWHTDPFLVPLRKHLNANLAGRLINHPAQAFLALWDLMPFGSFVASRDCFNEKYFLRFIGTSHAYVGSVWDSVADIMEKKNSCSIKCMESPTVLLRGAEKTWRQDSARIVLREIPLWFDLISEKTIYNKNAKIIKHKYLKRNTSFFMLANYRISNQLDSSILTTVIGSLTKFQKFKVILIAKAPLSVIKILVNLKTSLKASYSKNNIR